MACLVVIAGHAQVPGARGGFVGVDLFFVLSGFLITGILRDELEVTGRLRLWAFYLRRAARLYPALISAVLLAAFLRVVVDSAYPISRWDMGWALTYTMDIAMMNRHWGEALVHTWSLSIEEQFYLLWPVVMLLVRGRRFRLAVCAAGISLALTIGWLSSFSVVYFGPQVRGFEMLSGCALALSRWRPRRPSLTFHVGLSLFSISLAAAWVVSPGQEPRQFIATIALAVIASVLLVASARGAVGYIAELFRCRLVRRIGEISYGAYLFHMPLITLAGMQSSNRQAWLLLAGGAGLVLAEVSYRYVERPVLNWSTRWTSSHRLPAAPTGAEMHALRVKEHLGQNA